jgi:hypothetical protein
MIEVKVFRRKTLTSICVYQNWFFLINSYARKIYRPHLKIHQTDYRFLRQDSYISCSCIFEYATIDNDRKLGVFS